MGVLDGFEGGRGQAGRAMRDALARFRDEHLDEPGVLLEIGSGTGFMRRHWPDDDVTWLEMDIEREPLRASRERMPGGQQLQGSVYDIPLRDGSVDTVVGYLSYNDFRDIDTAMAETWRVLKPGGRFAHIVDMVPETSTLIDDLTEGGELPHWFYPTDLGDDAAGNVGYVPRENLDAARDRYPGLIGEIEETIRKEHMDEVWGPRRPGILRDLHGTYAEDVALDDYFRDWLTGALERAGAADIESGTVTGMYRGARTRKQREQGAFHAYSGVVDELIAEEPPGFRERAVYRVARVVPGLDADRFEPDVVEKATVQYVTARKAE